MIATAPGKLILAGEYAVLDGGRALVVAVDRRAVARLAPAAVPDPSPFLAAVAAELARRLGPAHPAVAAAARVVVDSAGFHDGGTKLGLGSSAAVTVAAAACALGAAAPDAPLDVDLVHAVAREAHAAAQGPRGSRGSGADVAAAVLGGALAFGRGEATRRAWPAGVALLPFFTGRAADTPSLVAAVARGRAERPAEVEAALAAIAAAAAAACAARGPALVEALAAGGRAILALGQAAGVALVPGCVAEVARALAELGGTAKTTGAGGGDVAVAIVPVADGPAGGEAPGIHADAVTLATRRLVELGCPPLSLAVTPTGVDLRRSAQ